MISATEILSEIGATLDAWIDGDEVVVDVSARPMDAELFVRFENDQIFMIQIQEIP